MQENDVLPSISTNTDALDTNIQPIHSNQEKNTLSPTLLSSSNIASVSRSITPNTSLSPSSSFPSDSLPRPFTPIQRSRSDQNIDRPSSYDPAVSDLIRSRSNVSFDANNVSEELPESRSSPFPAPRTIIPVPEDAVSSRLLQALPQLGIGHFLQGFTTQITPWRGFSTTRQDSGEDIEDINETGRLLSSQEGTEEEGGGFMSSSGRQGTSETPIYSMASSGNFERSENGSQSVAGDGTEPAADVPSTGRVETNSTRGRRDSEESDDQTAMDELQALFRRCHNSLPFVALFLIYFAYQHATGILVFVVGTAALMGLDQRMRAQVALKDKASTWHLLSIVTMCAIDMVAICSVEGKPNPVDHFSQILQLKTSHGSDSGSELLSTGSIFWQVLWTVLVNDFLIRLWSVVVKALVAGAKSDRFQCERKVRDEATTNMDESPAVVIADEETDSATTAAPLARQAVSTVAFYRRKRKLYGIIEMCSIFLRSLLASIPWCSFYQLCASKFMADVFTFAYLFIKGLILANQGRRIFRLVRSFVTLGLEFGVYVLPDELVEAGSPDCSICYESMTRPVKLACSHMFCEECVTEWFDHERSCPLCRASVESSGPTDAENVKPQYLDGRTSLVPQLL